MPIRFSLSLNTLLQEANRVCWACLVAACCVGSGPAIADEEKPVLLKQFGKEYVYDQGQAMSRLLGGIELLKDEVAKAEQTREGSYRFGESSVSNAIYGVLIALSNVGVPDEELKKQLYRLKDEFGGLPVPPFYGFGEERERFWKSFVVSEKNNGNLLTPGSLQAEFNLYRLVRQVEEKSQSAQAIALTIIRGMNISL